MTSAFCIVRVSTDRQDAAACVSLSFIHNVKEPESLSTSPASRATKHHRSLLSGTGRAVCSLSEAQLRVSVGAQPSVRLVYMLPHSPVSRHALQKFLRFFQRNAPNPISPPGKTSCCGGHTYELCPLIFQRGVSRILRPSIQVEEKPSAPVRPRL
jgi:hypothetical protein